MKRRTGFFVILAVLLCFFMISCNDTESSSEGAFSESEVIPSCEVDILKIGKADCIIINTGSHIVMIDTGEDKNVNDISDFMRDAGYDKIDTLILTHPDKDHIGGASEIISSFNVSTVIEGAYAPLTEDYTLYHMTMEDMNITPIILNGNYSFEFDGCEFLIDAPKKQKYTEKQSNNSSLVVSLTCGERRFLFCGDAMELRLAELTESEIGAHDFVKLPYHGNYLENYREFLDEVKPKYGAITCSGKNPADDRTIDLLIEYMVHAYQTKDGNINVLCDENKITITQK